MEKLAGGGGGAERERGKESVHRQSVYHTCMKIGSRVYKNVKILLEKSCSRLKTKEL